MKIEVINTTVSFGSRTVSAITEVRTHRPAQRLLARSLTDSTIPLQIWDVTNHRLCVTGVHNKMKPSDPKPKAEAKL